MSNPNMSLRDVEQWVQPIEPEGHLALCDPYTGVPLRGANFQSEPEEIPAIFAKDESLMLGYAHWRGGLLSCTSKLDPADPNGLGDKDTLRSMFEQFDAIGYTTKRSVLRSTMHPAPIEAGMTASGDFVPGDPHVATILETASEAGCFPFSLDQPTDINGNPATRAGQHLQELEDAVRTYWMEQADPTHPDWVAKATDMIYIDGLGWSQAATGGHEMEDLLMITEGRAKRFLLVQPPEGKDLARKIGLLAKENVEWAGTVHATDRIGSQEDHVAYPLSIQDGYIDAQMMA